MSGFLRAATGPVPAVTAAWVAAVILAVSHEPRHVLFVAMGLVGAFVAGLVGVGGAIVMFPLLLYVPPLVGLPALSAHDVSGVTMIQVAAAALAGVAGHFHHGQVRPALISTLGGGMVAGAFTGALVSSRVPGSVLVAVFASLALLAAIAMFLPPRWMPAEAGSSEVRFNRSVAVVAGVVVGALVGLVGAGGGFLLVPVMLFVLRVPMRAVVGASLGIVLLSGLSGAIGKVTTGQVDWHVALALVAGALPGAWAGAAVSRRVPARALGQLLGFVLALVAVKMWWEILTG